jgi:hypothetical protein
VKFEDPSAFSFDFTGLWSVTPFGMEGKYFLIPGQQISPKCWIPYPDYTLSQPKYRKLNFKHKFVAGLQESGGGFESPSVSNFKRFTASPVEEHFQK